MHAGRNHVERSPSKSRGRQASKLPVERTLPRSEVGNGFNFEWKTDRGLRGSLAALPVIAARRIGDLEKKLGDQLSALQDKISKVMSLFGKEKSFIGGANNAIAGLGDTLKTGASNLAGSFGGIFGGGEPIPFKVDASAADAALDTTTSASSTIGNIGSGSAEQCSGSRKRLSRSKKHSRKPTTRVAQEKRQTEIRDTRRAERRQTPSPRRPAQRR